MAANPIKQKLLADIEQAGGWEKVFERVASGESQTAIAASFGVTQGFLSRVIHLDAERVRAFREAKRLWAITLVEHTGELVKNVKENRDAIAKVREQASHAGWEASKWDRDLFGEDKGDVNVNVLNIAQWHIDALRHRTIDASPPPAEALQDRAAATAVPIGDASTAAPPAWRAGRDQQRRNLGRYGGALLGLRPDRLSARPPGIRAPGASPRRSLANGAPVRAGTGLTRTPTNSVRLGIASVRLSASLAHEKPHGRAGRGARRLRECRCRRQAERDGHLRHDLGAYVSDRPAVHGARIAPAVGLRGWREDARLSDFPARRGRAGVSPGRGQGERGGDRTRSVSEREPGIELRWYGIREGRNLRFSHCVRSEEHTSELQSPCNLVCRLLLEKKKK